MSSTNAKSLRNKIFEVLQYGKDRENGTRESLNQIMILEFPDIMKGGRINLSSELAECVGLYGEMGKDWGVKTAQEYHHYQFLTHALLHKINAVRYFHGEELESRKLIIFSDDCISSIQLVVREEEVGLLVHMRSSDAINLLPLDVMALTRILYKVIALHKIPIGPGKRVIIHITFGSLHIYDTDVEMAMKVGIGNGGEQYDETIRNNL